MKVLKDENEGLGVSAIAALASASKTPFWTSFKITLGIGLGGLVNFILGVSTITLIIYSIFRFWR